jgi:CPW-WPC domain-containing protein
VSTRAGMAVFLSLLLSFPLVPAAIQARELGNLRSLGEEVGVKVAELASQPSGPPSGLGNLGQMALVNPRVAAAAAAANQRAEEEKSVPAIDAVCARDWRVQCPETWTAISDHCIAPRSYEGPCAADVSSADVSSAKSKEKFAAECNVAWFVPQFIPRINLLQGCLVHRPCADSCEHNFDTCPLGESLLFRRRPPENFPCSCRLGSERRWQHLHAPRAHVRKVQ